MVYSTEQRNILLSFLKKNPDKMFCAKEIQSELEHQNISRSALYRNLASLEKDGLIRRCSKNESRDTYYQFFDSTSCQNHIHLSCKKCGKIFHMQNQAADSLILELEQTEGFELSKCDTTLYGLCRECNN